MSEEFVRWCRRKQRLWAAVKKYPAYGARVEAILLRVWERQKINDSL